MKKTNTNGVGYYSAPGWNTRYSIAHGFFTRTGGISPPPYDSLNVGPKGDDSAAHVQENLERVARALSIPAEQIFCSAQVHGDRIHRVSGTEHSIFGPDAPLQADGLVTAERGLYLGILTADCVPILLFDPGLSVVGAVHAGWRGTAKDISGKAVRKMRDEFGCKSSELLVAIGPAVGPCCYGVGEEVARVARTRVPEAVHVVFESPYYKVRVGDFHDRAAALQLRDRLRAYGYDQAWVVTTEVQAAPKDSQP